MPADGSMKMPLIETVRSAVRLRESLFGPFSSEKETSAYRLLNGEGDDLGGFNVDAYAGFLVVQVLSDEALSGASALEDALEQALRPMGDKGLKGIVRKLRHRQEERGRVPDETVRGSSPPDLLAVRENGIPFEVELRGGFHTGIFTDMREEHARLRALANGRRVLNTFAYTGAFSVAAALGGAAKVTSVDVVAKVLDRAKKNFRLSRIDPGAHHFARMEVLEYLRMAKRKGWTFDAIVLDPPTYAAFKSGTWSARKGYPELLDLALDALAPEGLLWAAANTEGMPAERLEKLIADAFKGAGRRAKVIAAGGLPPDYPTPAAKPEARYLKVYVVQAG
jgi:23S rRNA (cytosine1962-C5)-methyltransferase